MSLLHDMKLMSRDRIFLSRYKSIDLTGVLSLFERLRYNLLSLRQVSNMWRHKLDLLLFRSIAGTGDLSIKQVCSRYIISNDSSKGKVVQHIWR